MSSRLSGAVLALAAAGLLAISLATSAWWAGHPVSPTRTYTQIAHVGLHGAKLCLVDAAELETCKDAPTHSVFGPIGYVEMVACGLLVISALALGVMTLRRSEDRKTFALFVIGGAPLADALAVALIAIGPTSEATIPYGYGIYLFFVGSTTAIVAAVIARRPVPALVLAPARQAIAAAPMPMPVSQQLPGVDMAALMRDDTMRPSSPEPMLGSRPLPPSRGGNLAGPAGTLGAPTPQPDASPLFSSAPQLRPLYEAQGTAPVAPPPKFPARAPTPLPRDKIAAQTGMATPLPSRFAPASSPKPKPFSRTLPTAAPIEPAPRPKPASAPPPVGKPPISRTLPASVPPPPLQVATPTPAPETPAPSEATEPAGYAAVGDSTDVNVAVHTAPPQTDTEEVALAPRGSTQDDNAETVAREKISTTDVDLAKAPEVTPVPVPEKPVEKPKVSMSTAPDSLPPPIENKRAQSTSSPSPACPQCEAPMAWVEEHLRFYCKSCRMYF